MPSLTPSSSHDPLVYCTCRLSPQKLFWAQINPLPNIYPARCVIYRQVGQLCEKCSLCDRVLCSGGLWVTGSAEASYKTRIKNLSAEIKLTKQREEGVWSGEDTVCCWDKRKQREEDSNQRRNGNVNRVSVDSLSEVYQIWIKERIAINPPQAPWWNSSHNCSHAWGKDLHLTGNLPESAPTTALQQCLLFPSQSKVWPLKDAELRS